MCSPLPALVNFRYWYTFLYIFAQHKYMSPTLLLKYLHGCNIYFSKSLVFPKIFISSKGQYLHKVAGPQHITMIVIVAQKELRKSFLFIVHQLQSQSMNLSIRNLNNGTIFSPFSFDLDDLISTTAP